jgi:flagellar biosynthesis chaperone FliJ
MSLVGSEKRYRTEVRRVRIAQQLEFLQENLYDTQDELKAATLVIQQARRTLSELQKLIKTTEEPFGPEWP